jgi:hypothetical protein
VVAVLIAKTVLAELVNIGASPTVNVNFCVALGFTPLLAVMVKL